MFWKWHCSTLYERYFAPWNKKMVQLNESTTYWGFHLSKEIRVKKGFLKQIQGDWRKWFHLVKFHLSGFPLTGIQVYLYSKMFGKEIFLVVSKLEQALSSHTILGLLYISTFADEWRFIDSLFFKKILKSGPYSHSVHSLLTVCISHRWDALL